MVRVGWINENNVSASHLIIHIVELLDLFIYAFVYTTHNLSSIVKHILFSMLLI